MLLFLHVAVMGWCGWDFSVRADKAREMLLNLTPRRVDDECIAS